MEVHHVILIIWGVVAVMLMVNNFNRPNKK